MISVIVLAPLHHGGLARVADQGTPQLWEETVPVQNMSGFHPMLRFGSWDITRFNRSTTYMFTTPDLVQQGQFQIQGSAYYFRAVMANELENADKAKLAEENPSAANQINSAYAKSMRDFQGEYNERDKTLHITYPINGMPKTFELHATNEGDDSLIPLISSDAMQVAGLWQAPDPHSERLDARTRTKIQENGLEMFTKEASDSDEAQFAVMDLKVDGTFRFHKKTGRWNRSGSTVTLRTPGGDTRFQLSADGRKLLSGGKSAYIR